MPVNYDEKTGVMTTDETDDQFEKACEEAFATLHHLDESINKSLDNCEKCVAAELLDKYINLYEVLTK
jgi:hypothetical protein